MLPRLGALAIMRTIPMLGALQVLLILIGLLCQVPDDQVWRQTENSRNDKESWAALEKVRRLRGIHDIIYELVVHD